MTDRTPSFPMIKMQFVNEQCSELLYRALLLFNMISIQIVISSATSVVHFIYTAKSWEKIIIPQCFYRAKPSLLFLYLFSSKYIFIHTAIFCPEAFAFYQEIFLSSLPLENKGFQLCGLSIATPVQPCLCTEVKLNCHSIMCHKQVIIVSLRFSPV